MNYAYELLRSYIPADPDKIRNDLVTFIRDMQMFDEDFSSLDVEPLPACITVA